MKRRVPVEELSYFVTSFVLAVPALVLDVEGRMS